jgi:hypothetical protein
MQFRDPIKDRSPAAPKPYDANANIGKKAALEAEATAGKINTK